MLSKDFHYGRLKRKQVSAFKIQLSGKAVTWNSPVRGIVSLPSAHAVSYGDMVAGGAQGSFLVILGPRER